MSQYSSKLRDPRWQKKRLEIFEAAGWECQQCGAETKELHAHHMIYRRGRNPWEYTEKEIVALCSDCHEKIGMVQEQISAVMLEYGERIGPLSVYNTVLGFCQGLMEKAKSTNENYVKGFKAGMMFVYQDYVDYRTHTTFEESKKNGESHE
jgi:hypothetical protein